MKKAIDPLFAETFAPQLRKGDRKKYEILAAAVDQIAKHGLTSATFEQVAESLGTRRSHVSYYFGTREELFLGVVRYSLANAQRITIELLQGQPQPEGQLRAVVRGAFKWAKAAPNQTRIFLLFHFYASTDPVFAEVSEAFREAARGRIASILAEWTGLSESKVADCAQAVHAEIMGQLFEALCVNLGKELARYQDSAEAHCLALAATLPRKSAKPRSSAASKN